MGDLLGVSVEQLISILKQKQARLPFEIGTFVALETCEALLQGPAKVSPADVRVSEDGHVSVFAPPNSATGAEAAQSVVGVLAHVLVAAGPGVPPVLLELVEHGPSDGRWDLARLRDELEASLVPLNRQAARRVLSRMLREARREGVPMRAGQAEPSEPDDVDAELDALIGGPPASPEPAPVPPPAEPAAPPVEQAPVRPGDAIWPDQEQGFDEEAPTSERPVAPPPRRRGAVADSISTTLEREVPADNPFADDVPTARERRPGRSSSPAANAEAPPKPRRELARDLGEREKATPIVARDLDLSGIDEEIGKKKGRPMVWALVFLVLVGALLGTVAWLRPDAVDRFLGRTTPEQREAEQREAERREEQRRLDQEQAGRFGTLVVHATPPESQVLLFVGRGPAVAHNLPPGVAHEFIAIADGREPTRAVVPTDAEWEQTDDGLRYELAMQAGEDEMSFEELDLGDTRLPRDMGEPGTELGSVRVVTNPPGAKVYMLIGFSPTVRVENARTDRSVELLVWHADHVPKRVVVGPSDWREADGERRAEVEVELEER